MGHNEFASPHDLFRGNTNITSDRFGKPPTQESVNIVRHRISQNVTQNVMQNVKKKANMSPKIYSKYLFLLIKLFFDMAEEVGLYPDNPLII